MPCAATSIWLARWDAAYGAMQVGNFAFFLVTSLAFGFGACTACEIRMPQAITVNNNNLIIKYFNNYVVGNGILGAVSFKQYQPFDLIMDCE